MQETSLSEELEMLEFREKAVFPHRKKVRHSAYKTFNFALPQNCYDNSCKE